MQSGIQEPDSSVPVKGQAKTIYGMRTVRKRISPWQVEVTDDANPGKMKITSQAPTTEALKAWYDECNAAPVSCDLRVQSNAQCTKAGTDAGSPMHLLEINRRH